MSVVGTQAMREGEEREKKGEHSVGTAASETVSTPQTPEQQPQEQSQAVSLHSGTFYSVLSSSTLR